MRSTLLSCTALLLSTALGSLGAVAQDAGHDKDYRTFHQNGEVEYGDISDTFTADLVMYVAGNQFMVMEDLVKGFLAQNEDVASVYVKTIPPGQILNNFILDEGKVDGQTAAQNPDLYASVNLGHLRTLREAGLMHDYVLYTHNKLELMVAEGNPKGIEGVEDLGRDDLVQSHPNPLTEGIFKFYGTDMLKQAGLYEEVTGGAQCKGCWAVEGKTWFTDRHHRETPQRIEDGLADVGIVWTTEVLEAEAEGRAIEGVPISDELNMKDRVGYAMGVLTTARNPVTATRFLSYLSTDDAQAIYESFGFVRAAPEDRKLQPIAGG